MSDFSHMKSKVEVVTFSPYKKKRQCSYDRRVEMFMKTENTCRVFGFLNIKCVMERFTYFMECTLKCVSQPSGWNISMCKKYNYSSGMR